MTMTRPNPDREERRRKQKELADRLKSSGALDEIFARIDAGELDLTGEEGFIPGLIKAALERGLQAELTGHLGYERGDPEASLFANSRNGSTAKTVAEIGVKRSVAFIPICSPHRYRTVLALFVR